MKRVLLGAVGLGVAVVLAIGIRGLVEDRRELREVLDLRGRVYEARVSADSCRNELAYAESRFRQFDALVDTLLEQVRDFEAMDPRGVPNERYDEYMEHFDRYNDSVAVWEARAEALRASDRACRILAEDHNVLADSLRSRVEGLAEGG